MTIKDAYLSSQRQERWVFPDTVCSSLTMLYGRSNVGKSYLIASMLLSLVAAGRDFLGMQPTDTEKVWHPAILWTDPGSTEEYGERIFPEIPEGADIGLYHLGRTSSVAEWEILSDYLIDRGHNFVVVDNLMGVTGDTNDTSIVTTVFDGLTKLTNRGIPVVLVHHESEKGPVIAGASPMGASEIVQKSRVWIQARQTQRRKLRGGNTALVIQANTLSQPQQLVLEPLTGPSYKVLNRGPWGSADEAVERPKEKRSKDTLDQRAAFIAWSQSHAGLSQRQAAEMYVRENPSLKLNVNTVRTWFTTGKSAAV